MRIACPSDSLAPKPVRGSSENAEKHAARYTTIQNRERTSAARRALAYLCDEGELLRVPLLPETAPRKSYDDLRAAILRALESLAPASPAENPKQQRRHDILLRCDLHGEPHKAAIEALGLSRRQFYRERQEALLQLARAIEAELARTSAATVSLALGDAAEAYIEALRAAGQYRLAWRESLELAARADGESREVQLWSVACEAARYVGDHSAAAEALDRARRAASGLRGRDGSYARTLWIAIGEINQYWAQAECDRAREAFDAAVRAGRDETTLNPNETKLFGIMLGYMAAVEGDCGQWERAERLYARERRLSGTEASATTRSSLLRLSARIADARGDRQRAIAEHRSALEIERKAGQLGPVAVSAVYYAAAIGETNPAQALPYAEYGLEITRRYYPGDRLAKLTLQALPVILDAAGPNAARRALASVPPRRPRRARHALSRRGRSASRRARRRSCGCGRTRNRRRRAARATRLCSVSGNRGANRRRVVREVRPAPARASSFGKLDRHASRRRVARTRSAARHRTWARDLTTPFSTPSSRAR